MALGTSQRKDEGARHSRSPWLVALVVQNTALTIIMSHSRTMPVVNGTRYSASTAIVMAEVLKLVISMTMALVEVITSPQASQSTTTIAGLFGEVGGVVFTGDSWKMAVPAMLYTAQNSLQYFAVGNLDTASFQAIGQLKLLTTAVLGVFLLGKSLGTRKWAALVLLALGAVLISIPISFNHEEVLTIHDLRKGVAFHSPRSIWDLKALGSKAAKQLDKRSATYEGIDEDYAAQNVLVHPLAGLAAIIFMCVLSGIAGTYLERVLRESKGNTYSASIWIRNVQLSFYSLWPALFIGVMFVDGEVVARTGFFAGYNWSVWATVVLQAIGGMLVALVVKMADSLVKTTTTSFSVIVTVLASLVVTNHETTFFVSLTLRHIISSTNHCPGHDWYGYCACCNILVWHRRG
jgi:UDP-sugar transporter A1/2/3